MKSFDIKTKIYFGDNALDRLADLPYKKALIITDPFVVKSGMLQIVPSWLCNAVDTTGAGDVFHGAFTYGVHYSWHIDNIILFASLTAAISIEKKGVRESMPDLAVVHHSLNSYERNLTQYFEE